MADSMLYKRPKRLSAKRHDYRALAEVHLPRQRPKKHAAKDGVYRISIVEEDEERSRVKVHYIGWPRRYDEWKQKSELIAIRDNDTPSDPDVARASAPQLCQPTWFSLYYELGTKIKQSLYCGRKDSPSVCISMPFDKIQFEGGLKSCGIASRNVHGIQRYKVRHYRDLNHLLGSKWHFRGLNCNGDYGYVVLQTVEFYVYKRRPITEYGTCFRWNNCTFT